MIEMDMFCYQCQETANNTGCTKRGVCGKSAEVAILQDLLLWTLKGLSFYGVKARELDVKDANADLFVAQALFATITNANFDSERFVVLIREALAFRDGLRDRFMQRYQEEHRVAFSSPVPEAAIWEPVVGDLNELLEKGRT
jgi:hydroxylamine reductase